MELEEDAADVQSALAGMSVSSTGQEELHSNSSEDAECSNMSQSEISLEDDGGSEEEEGEGNHFLGHLTANGNASKAHHDESASSSVTGGDMVAQSGVTGGEHHTGEEAIHIKSVESDSCEDDLEEAFSAL